MRGKTSTVRPSRSEKESAGLENGLTERSDFMATQTVSDAAFNTEGSKAPGYTRQVKGQRSSESAKKFGYSFEIEGCKSGNSDQY